MGSLKAKLGLLVAMAVIALFAPGAAHAQALPPFPAIFSGTVLLGGQPAPSGTKVYGQVATYRSTPATIGENGRFVGLVVGPPSAEMVGQPVLFIYQGLRANETYRFTGSLVEPQTITLNFPALPLTGDQFSGAWLLLGALGLVLLSWGALIMRRSARIY